MSKCSVMYSLFLSFCGYRTFPLVQYLNMIRCTILSNKIRNSYYTSGASTAFKPVTLSVTLEGLKYKKSLGKFKNVSQSVITSVDLSAFHYFVLVQRRTNS